MDLVKRYVAAVQRELPDNKREEIGRELEANIMDQLDAQAEQQGPLTDNAIALVLKAMGHPCQVAQQFAPIAPLIASEHMQIYRYTLYMVLAILLVLQVFDSTANWLQHDVGLLLFLKSILSGFIEDACFAFTAITLGFIVMTRAKPQPLQQTKEWQVEQLPPLQASKQHILLQDIFTDLATDAFLLAVIWYWFWLPPEELAGKSVWLAEHAQHVLLLASPLLIGSVLLTLWQLSARQWNKGMQLINIALNIGFIVIMLYLAFNDPLLQINEHSWVNKFGWDRLQYGVTWILLIGACWPAYEIIRDVIRLRRVSHKQ